MYVDWFQKHLPIPSHFINSTPKTKSSFFSSTALLKRNILQSLDRLWIWLGMCGMKTDLNESVCSSRVLKPAQRKSQPWLWIGLGTVMSYCKSTDWIIIIIIIIIQLRKGSITTSQTNQNEREREYIRYSLVYFIQVEYCTVYKEKRFFFKKKDIQ